MLNLIPLPYRIGLLGVICGALYVFGMMHGESVVNAKWSAQRAAIQAAEVLAVNARLADNANLEAKHAADNALLTKVHDEEIADVRARLAAASRMRVPAFCPRLATTTETASASGSNGTDSGGGLVPVRVEQDIHALILKTEEVAATARACQRFITDNGLAP